MKILFLDDSAQRWYNFQSKVPSAWRVATAEECIKTIKEWPKIDWLFLDHDLGGETWVDTSREDCGMEVVRFLCEQIERVNSIHNIVVHSHNISAAEEMFNKLKDAGYNVKLVPFNNLIKSINYN
jgi:hypothetical protein